MSLVCFYGCFTKREQVDDYIRGVVGAKSFSEGRYIGKWSCTVQAGIEGTEWNYAVWKMFLSFSVEEGRWLASCCGHVSPATYPYQCATACEQRNACITDPRFSSLLSHTNRMIPASSYQKKLRQDDITFCIKVSTECWGSILLHNSKYKHEFEAAQHNRKSTK